MVLVVIVCCILDQAFINVTSETMTNRHIFPQIRRQTPLRNDLQTENVTSVQYIQRITHTDLPSVKTVSTFVWHTARTSLARGFEYFIFIYVWSLWNCSSEPDMVSTELNRCCHFRNCTEGRSCQSQCCITAIRQQVVPLHRNKNITWRGKRTCICEADNCVD